MYRACTCFAVVVGHDCRTLDFMGVLFTGSVKAETERFRKFGEVTGDYVEYAHPQMSPQVIRILMRAYSATLEYPLSCHP